MALPRPRPTPAQLFAFSLGGALVAGLPGHAVVDRDCALPEANCTLAEAAARAGVFAGAAVNPRVDDPDTQFAVPTHFNSITAENAMKWGVLARRVGSYDFREADALVDFAGASGVRVRGHALLWGRGPLPADLVERVGSGPGQAARLREILVEHITTVAGRYAGRVESWDVVNEPLEVFGGGLDPNLFLGTLGPGYIAESFRAAHAADPQARLFLNEFFPDFGGAKARAFVALVEELVAAGVPIHGVGVQTHAFLRPPPYPAFPGFLAELAALGLDVELTELDVLIVWSHAADDPLAAQAEHFAGLVGACLVLPACTGITTWGITDADTWLDSTPPFALLAPNRPLLFDEALAPKPAYFAVRDAFAARAVSFSVQAARILADFETAVEAGELVARSAGLAGLRAQLAQAGRLLERARYRPACGVLGAAGRRLDGEPRPPDLASGPAAPKLARAIAELRRQLECERSDARRH